MYCRTTRTTASINLNRESNYTANKNEERDVLEEPEKERRKRQKTTKRQNDKTRHKKQTIDTKECLS